MRESFEEALGKLLERYADESIEDLISAMEIALAGLHDDEKFLASEKR